MAGGERLPLRVPHTGIRDPRVHEHDARALAGRLRPQTAARNRDVALEIAHSTTSRSR